MKSEQEPNLVGVLRARAKQEPNKTAFTFLDGDAEVAGTLTFAQLHDRAGATAARLLRVAAPGDRALLLHPAGLDYVTAFYGCLYAGIIAVPLYVPQKRTVPLVEAIAQDCAATIVLTTEQGAKKHALFAAESPVGNLPWLTSDTPDGAGFSLPEPDLTPDTIAYLQYTSGSTAAPKGVIIDHANMVRQCAELAQSWHVDSTSRWVTWLPHFHDFGQVATVLLPVHAGCESVRMAPTTFIQRPIRWLQAISRYRGTHTGAPNFAFDLCVDGTVAAERAEVDLGSLITASVGAEPVLLDTLRRFRQTFAGHGLGPQVLCPAYGLAEATLKVTSTQPDEPLAWGSFDTAALGRLVAEQASTDTGRPLVGCGTVVPDTQVAIVDPDTRRRVPDDHVGEIWVSGPIVSRGYWARPEETEATFQAHIEDEPTVSYLRTGDLAFRHDDQLYICGRIKDVVIVNGVNHYPQDIERTVEKSHAAVRSGRSAVFGVEVEGLESVVVVAECARHDETPPQQVALAIRAAISRDHELAATIVITETGAISLTTSGKIQRGRCRPDFLRGRLPLRYRLDASSARSGDRFDPLASSDAFGSAAASLRDGSRTHIMSWVRREVLGGVGNADGRQSLSAHGLTSVHLMELHLSIEEWAGVRVPHEWMWESASIDELAGLVADRLTNPVATTGAGR